MGTGTRHGHPLHLERWRQRIDTTRILMRLQAHVEGQVQLTPTQIKAAEILLRKTMPDLQSVALTGADGQSVVQFSWMQPAAVIENSPSTALISDAVMVEAKA